MHLLLYFIGCYAELSPQQRRVGGTSARDGSQIGAATLWLGLLVVLDVWYWKGVMLSGEDTVLCAQSVPKGSIYCDKWWVSHIRFSFCIFLSALCVLVCWCTVCRKNMNTTVTPKLLPVDLNALMLRMEYRLAIAQSG